MTLSMVGRLLRQRQATKNSCIGYDAGGVSVKSSRTLSVGYASG